MHTAGPFVVHESDAPLTVPVDPDLATEHRAVDRHEFDEHVTEKMREQEVCVYVQLCMRNGPLMCVALSAETYVSVQGGASPAVWQQTRYCIFGALVARSSFQCHGCIVSAVHHVVAAVL